MTFWSILWSGIRENLPYIMLTLYIVAVSSIVFSVMIVVLQMGPFEPTDTEEQKRRAEIEEDAMRYREMVEEMDRIAATPVEQMIPYDTYTVPEEWGG